MEKNETTHTPLLQPYPTSVKPEFMHGNSEEHVLFRLSLHMSLPQEHEKENKFQHVQLRRCPANKQRVPRALSDPSHANLGILVPPNSLPITVIVVISSHQKYFCAPRIRYTCGKANSVVYQHLQQHEANQPSSSSGVQT